MARQQEIISYLFYILILVISSLTVLRFGRPIRGYLINEKKSSKYKFNIKVIISSILIIFNICLVYITNLIVNNEITIDSHTIKNILEGFGAGITIGSIGTIFMTSNEKKSDKSEE